MRSMSNRITRDFVPNNDANDDYKVCTYSNSIETQIVGNVLTSSKQTVASNLCVFKCTIRNETSSSKYSTPLHSQHASHPSHPSSAERKREHVTAKSDSRAAKL